MKRCASHPTIAAILLGAGCVAPAPRWTLEPRLETRALPSTALFIGLHVVDETTVWISGTGGAWGLTVDGGATWRTGIVEGADSLQFRDVHALDAATAWLLSIGDGRQSRIYHTVDGGESWQLQFLNPDPRAFFDCFDFWDAYSGLVFGDSYDGAFPVLETADGGRTWTPLSSALLPAAALGEGGFAASGTCLVAAAPGTAWIGTGASAGGARVLRTTDRGRSWSVAETPIVRGPSRGITTLAFRDSLHGAALGGDIAQPDSMTDNVAFTSDGGRSWVPGGRPTFTGAVYGAAWVPGAPTPTLIATGPRGMAVSTDAGRTWSPIDTLNHWNVGFASPDRGWAVGPGGRITRIRLFARS